jgi:mRNA-degrading endonuclease RelE of RelBE toxin-antitoxin system
LKVKIDQTFRKDLNKLNDKRLEKKVAAIIESIINANKLNEVKNLKSYKALINISGYVQEITELV